MAAGSYGPPPPPTPVPGGFFRVITSQTICPGGGTIGPVQSGVLQVTLRVPAGAFPVCVQITLTEPEVTGIGNAGFAGYRAFGGVGVQVQKNGRSYPGTFLKPLGLTMASSQIHSSTIAVVWNGTRFVQVAGASVRPGVVSLTFDSDPDFAVLNPITSAIPGATKAVTGKPLLGEGILAGLLLATGAGGLAYVRRRRAASGRMNLSGQ